MNLVSHSKKVDKDLLQEDVRQGNLVEIYCEPSLLQADSADTVQKALCQQKCFTVCYCGNAQLLLINHRATAFLFDLAGVCIWSS